MKMPERLLEKTFSPWRHTLCSSSWARWRISKKWWTACYHAYKRIHGQLLMTKHFSPWQAEGPGQPSLAIHLLSLVVHCKCSSLHCYRSRVNGGLEDARRLYRCCERPICTHFSWTTYPKFEILIFSIKLDLHPMKFSCYVVPQVIREGNEKHPSSLMSYQVMHVLSSLGCRT